MPLLENSRTHSSPTQEQPLNAYYEFPGYRIKSHIRNQLRSHPGMSSHIRSPSPSENQGAPFTHRLPVLPLGHSRSDYTSVPGVPLCQIFPLWIKSAVWIGLPLCGDLLLWPYLLDSPSILSCAVFKVPEFLFLWFCYWDLVNCSCHHPTGKPYYCIEFLSQKTTGSCNLPLLCQLPFHALSLLGTTISTVWRCVYPTHTFFALSINIILK